MPEEWMHYIKPELLILVPVLYLIGMFLKSSKKIDDCNIPLYLGLAGILLSAVFLAATLDNNHSDLIQAVFASVTQGILLAGMAVYTNQIVKQAAKAK